MTIRPDSLLDADPRLWLDALKPYQRSSVDELTAQGKSFEQIAEMWLSARPGDTFAFGAAVPGQRSVFLDKLTLEIEAFLCGDERYNVERTRLFGEQGLARTYIVGVIAVAIAPTLGVSATFLAPAIALVLASLGKITLNAWCASRKEARAKTPPATPSA